MLVWMVHHQKNMVDLLRLRSNLLLWQHFDLLSQEHLYPFNSRACHPLRVCDQKCSLILVLLNLGWAHEYFIGGLIGVWCGTYESPKRRVKYQSTAHRRRLEVYTGLVVALRWAEALEAVATNEGCRTNPTLFTFLLWEFSVGTGFSHCKLVSPYQLST